MATLQLHPIFGEITGRLGDHVLRRVNGRTIICARPDMSRVKASPAQVEQRNRFRAAANYARSALADPAQREFYARIGAGKRTARSVAMRDFLGSPAITLLDVSRYTGRAGEVILVDATDDTAVATVKVEIRDRMSTLLESGYARFAGAWTYRTTTQPACGYPLTILAVARDHAGNQAQLAAPWVPPGYAALADQPPCRLIT